MKTIVVEAGSSFKAPEGYHFEIDANDNIVIVVDKPKRLELYDYYLNWISVQEKLPNEDCYCWVFSENEVKLANYHTRKEKFAWVFYMNNVTHWLPIEKPSNPIY